MNNFLYNAYEIGSSSPIVAPLWFLRVMIIKFLLVSVLLCLTLFFPTEGRFSMFFYIDHLFTSNPSLGPLPNTNKCYG